MTDLDRVLQVLADYGRRLSAMEATVARMADLMRLEPATERHEPAEAPPSAA